MTCRRKMSLRKSWLFRILVFVTGEGYYGSGASHAFIDGLRSVVLAGRLLGTISQTDVLEPSSPEKKSQRRINLTKIISGLLTLFFLLNAVLLIRANFLRFQSIPSGSQKLDLISLPGYACTMFFVYAYMFVRTRRFRKVVQSFSAAHVGGVGGPTVAAYQFPGTFTRFCWITTVGCLLFGITENVMYDVKSLKNAREEGNANGSSLLELYYIQNFYHWNVFIPYHPILILVFVILIKCGTWGWVYCDVIAIVLSKALTEKFRMMNEEIGQIMVPAPHNKSKLSGEGRIITTLTWDLIRDEFVMLANLVLEVQKFIAPLILACYGVNIYIIMTNLFYWIAPYSKFSTEQSFYVYFAFVQFSFRVMSVTYFAAEVHHVSHSILRTIQRCPNSLYTLSLERLERTLICNPVGINLFGSFMITRAFFVSILSFLFTTEIVLLQTANTSSASQNRTMSN